VLGGDDIDHWMLDEMLSRTNLSRVDIGTAYPLLKVAVEQAKIRLSDHETSEINVTDHNSNRTYQTTFSRSQFEEILDRHEFYGDIHKTLDKALRSARSHGIHPEDVDAVLMIGGSSLIPSVKRTLRTLFSSEKVYDKLPFEAVAHGAAYLSAGIGVDDFIIHSYGVRHLSPITGRHEWEEIIPSGVHYPMHEPVKLVLTASRDGQDALELVIGEVEESSGGMTEVMFGDRAILLVEGGLELRRVVALNDSDGARTFARLDPPGKAGEDRVEVEFTVDENRILLVTVIDIISKQVLLSRKPVIELR
jgi:molecular chaperone DnaK (HSP70)